MSMRLIKFGVLNTLFLFFILMTTISFAQEIDYNYEIKILTLSAKALEQSHPKVSNELEQYVHDRTLWRDVIKTNKVQGEDEKAEMLTTEKRVAHIKLLRDTALLLQQSDASLAKELNDLADTKHKKMSEIDKKRRT